MSKPSARQKNPRKLENSRHGWNALKDTAKRLKFQKQLNRTQSKRVKDAVEFLTKQGSSERRQKHQCFLDDVLEKGGPEFFLVCAIALPQGKLANTRKDVIDGLLSTIVNNKGSNAIKHPNIRSYAAQFKVPRAVDDQLPRRNETLSSPQESGQRGWNTTEVPIGDADNHSQNETDGRAGSPNHIGSPEALSKSNEEARQNPSASAASTAISTSCANGPPSETQSELTAVPEISSNDSNIAIAQEQEVFENASLRGIAKVFDEYMCSAIRRVTVDSDLKAAVTMVFPVWGGPVDCVMSLYVCERDVEQLAMALFNAKVKWVEQVLHVVLREGITLIIPNSEEATLKGVPDEAIIKVFGPEIYDTITQCPIRKRELAEGKHVTECVSVILTKNGAIINLSLGLRGGREIQNKLYT